MLRGYRAVFHGPVQDRWTGLADITTLRWPLILLLAMLLIAGFCPQIFVHLVKPVLAQFLTR
jgi:NADH:ubiquinone oxidoreductase subunit 4 (subunit M)